MRAIKEYFAKPIYVPPGVELKVVRGNIPGHNWNSVRFVTPTLNYKDPIAYNKLSPWHYTSVNGMPWFTSCAAYLVSDLHISPNLGDLELQTTLAAHMLVKLHPPLMGSGFGQQNVFYLARDPRDAHAQKDVIVILEKLGFEQVKGSEMNNVVHGSKLSLYARLMR